MPRHKTEPKKRRNSIHDPNESYLDDEEVQRLERELDSLRREKARQIRIIRERREARRREYGHSESSSESEISQLCELDDVENPVDARPATRNLANGLEKAQQRFMFNVRQIEEKWKDGERRGALESKIEIDRYGNFYFPETLAPCHQQAFVNKLFQNDAQFGKGTVSAPRNSIQSLEGDEKALQRCKKLDDKFGRKIRRSEVFEEVFENRERIRSNATGITLNTVFSDEDDDVFDTPVHSRRPTTSTISSLFREHEGEDSEEDREFADDEEDSEEDEISDEEEDQKNSPIKEILPRIASVNLERKVGAPKVEEVIILSDSEMTKCRKIDEFFKPIPKNQKKWNTPKRKSMKKEVVETPKLVSTQIASDPKTPSTSEPQSRNVTIPKVETDLGQRTLLVPKLEKSLLKSSDTPGASESTSMSGNLVETVKTPKPVSTQIASDPKTPSTFEPHPEKVKTPKVEADSAQRTLLIPKLEKSILKSSDTPAASGSSSNTPTSGNLAKTVKTPKSENPDSVKRVSLSRTRKSSAGKESTEKNVSASIPPKLDIKQVSEQIQTPKSAVLKKSIDSTPKNSASQKATCTPDIPGTSKSEVNASKDSKVEQKSTSSNRRPVPESTKTETPTVVNTSNSDLKTPASQVVKRNSTVVKVAGGSIEISLSDSKIVKTPAEPANDPPSSKKKKVKTPKSVDSVHDHSGKAGKKNVPCKHCEYEKEEKKKAQLEAKNNAESVSVNSKQTPNTTFAKKKKETPKETKKTSSPGTSGMKRRSATVVAQEPDKKKQKLNESDILSIPSSTAVAVDIELMAAENPDLSPSKISKFSQKTDREESVWNTTVDSQWIRDVKKVGGKAKDPRFFGVPMTKNPEGNSMIGFWVDNISSHPSEKDPFDADLRRSMAQDKKARIDVKAGYDVRL